MMEWRQLDHMQIICTSLQPDNHAGTLPLSRCECGTIEEVCTLMSVVAVVVYWLYSAHSLR